MINGVARVAQRLNEIRHSYNNVALNTTLVAGQLSTIRAALEALYEWRASDQASTGPSKQLDKDLGMSLSCCAILIGVIDGKLDDSGHMPGLKEKIKYIWLENILKDYTSNLEGQVRALQLLLTIFQCRTATEKKQKLDDRESRTIIEQVRVETASLALDNIEFQDAASVLSLDPSVTLDIDSILLNSPAYKRVYRHARLRMPPVVRANPIEISKEAACPDTAPPFQTEKPRTPPLPLRPTRKSIPQSRARINVWEYCPGQEERDYNADPMMTVDSGAIFELPGETHESITASQPNEESRRENDIPAQRQEIASEMAGREVKTPGVESSLDNVSVIKPLSMQTKKLVPTPLPAAEGETASISALEGFMKELNLAFEEKSSSQDNNCDLGLLYGTAASINSEQSHDAVITRDDLRLSGRKSLREEEVTPSPKSTHSSLYECSISAVPKEQSTRTSSPYSCVSCRNLDVTSHNSENDRLEAEIHELVRSSPQLRSESVDIPEIVADGTQIDSVELGPSQESTATAGANALNQSQSQPSAAILPILPKKSTIEKCTYDVELARHSSASVDILANSEPGRLERIETSQPTGDLGLRHVKTAEMIDPHPQVNMELPPSTLPPRKIVPLTNLLPSPSAPGLALFPSAEYRNAESEQSTLSSNRGSSAHDARSTISSSEAPENSTILSLQQSTSSTTATSIDSRAPGLGLEQAQSDLRRLHGELTTAKARGDSRAVQDSLQRSIEVIRRTYLAKPPAEDKNVPEKSPSPRLGKARSNIMRFSSLHDSTKGVALGDFAASGNTMSVQNILKEKVNVDSRSDSFKTPLMRAAMNGHIECMKLLKQYGADEVAVDAKGRTTLHMAVASNRLAAVKWLLETYPMPRLDPLKHRPSLLFRATDVVKGVRSQKNLRETSDAEGSKPLHIAAELDRGGMVKTLIGAGVDIDSKDNWGRTPFHRAIIAKRRDVFDALIRSGAKITAVDAKSVSSLHFAAQAGQVDMIETLLANGAKRWDFDSDGYQPIHSAVLGGNPSAVEALLTERTDVEKRTQSGETLLHLACLKKKLELGTYLLTKLVDVNPWATPSPGVSEVLAHTRIKGSSMTPLHYACCTRDFEMAVLLLDHEALVNAPTPEGSTALMMAVETEDTNMVNLLLQREAKVNAKIPGSLVTALHLAARRGDLETVQQLCRHGADDSARTYSSGAYGRSPLEECAKCPDKKKRQTVEQYIQTIFKNRVSKTLRAHQVSHSESHQPHQNPSEALEGQIRPLALPLSYAPWVSARHGYSADQEYVVQQAQALNAQYYHPDFDVPDDILPAYQPGPSAPARLATQAPVHRERYT